MKYMIFFRYSLPLLALFCASYTKAQTVPAYAQTAQGQAFINQMATEGFDKAALNQLFSTVYRDDAILQKISKPAEKTTPWFKYRKIFSDSARITNGVRFYQMYEKTLNEAYQQYGVPAAIIVAIIGVETRYGKVMGKDAVLTALSTIAFDYPKRSPFFTKELREFLIMSKEEGIDPRQPKGSYAGAMGMAQFMPSSFRHYAVDYEGDGKRDLWQNPRDAIFSIANYLHKNGWQRNMPIVDDALIFYDYLGKTSHKLFAPYQTLSREGIFAENLAISPATEVGLLALDGEQGKLFFITLKNFNVITTYNTSPMYALAVTELARSILTQLPEQVAPQNQGVFSLRDEVVN